MQLSTAIMAGSTLCRAKAKPTDRTNQEGCALTMGCLAVGSVSTTGRNIWHDSKKVWPWLEITCLIECPKCRVVLSEAYWMVIHIFDFHVMEEKDFTLEQLVDYVRSIEPRELPDLPLSEQHRLEEIDAEREALVSGRDPIHDSNGRW